MADEELARTINNCLTRRRVIKAQLTQFKTFLTQQEADPKYDRIQTRLESITEHFQEFKGIQRTLEEEEPENNHEVHRFEIEDNYHDAIAQARGLLRNSAPRAGLILSETDGRSTSSPITVTVPPSLPTRKLPDLNPPKFDGQLENWATFKSRFISMIDKNSGLSSSDKLDYLQSALSGKAARVIEALETTASSYQDAWDLLIAKYDNDRKAVLRHLTILREFPPLQRDTAEALDELVDTFRQQLRSLKNLGQAVSGCDALGNAYIISILLTKIGKSTAYQWELTLADNKMPAYTSLLDFLAKRANCSDTRQLASHNHDPKTQSKQDKRAGTSRGGQRQTYLTSHSAMNNSNQQANCDLCKESHYTAYCPKLKELSVEERIKAAQTAELCLNCLRRNHKTRVCKSEKRCKVCRKPHHTLLHINQPRESAQTES